ncbi:MAG TPA: hypothetical protein VMF64_05175 [Steroidobacteraceae bacterium]|nr:hypothetical protein [Steroidobacteraceae bacterium]
MLAGCGHHGGQKATDSAADDGDTQSIGGVWNGADSSGRTIVGLADEAGEFHLLRDDGMQYAGTATTRGDAVSATARRLTRPGGAKGSEDEAASLTGKVQQRESMSLRIVPAAGAPPFPHDTISLQFNPLYDSPSSLATFAGEYTDGATGNTITVTAGGTLFWRDSRDGCLASGAVSLIDAHHDLYEVQFSYSACQGADAELNGVQFSGLGTLETTLQPVQAIIGVTGEARGRGYAIDLTLSRLPPRSPI